MALSSVATATLLGVAGYPARIEAHLSPGLPGLNVAGQPASSVRDLRDRVRTAFLSSGLPWPTGQVTITVAPQPRWLTPALDLPIAVAALAAAGHIPAAGLEGWGFVGELGLDGSLRTPRGIVALTGAVTAGNVVVPAACAHEARLAGHPGTLHAAATLAETAAALRGQQRWPTPAPPAGRALPALPAPGEGWLPGGPTARLAVEVAAAGGHHLLALTTEAGDAPALARAVVGLLADLTPTQALEVARARSAAGMALPPALPTRPPHESAGPDATATALLGGPGPSMAPGLAALAHHGVLSLYGLADFAPQVLDLLHVPLTQGQVTVARGGAAATYPTRTLAVATLAPCRCAGREDCRCPTEARRRYQRRVARLPLDHFPLRVDLAAAGPALGAPPPGTTPAARVAAARHYARGRGAPANAHLPAHRIDQAAPLEPEAAAELRRQVEAGNLSPAGTAALRRVARTIADITTGHPHSLITAGHIAAALALHTSPT